MSGNAIRYLKRSEVNASKWDACMDISLNGLIYGYTFYLDQMAKNWDALVLGDYEAIMPVTWNKKWGIRYLYQPPFTQQLGIFSGKQLTQSLIGQFIDELQFHFRFGEIFLNHGNRHPVLGNRSNFIVPLKSGYEELFSHYKPDAVRNIRRARKFSLIYGQDVQPATALNVYKTQYAERFTHVKNSDFHRFEQLCDIAVQKGELVLRGTFGPGKNLLATAVLLRKNKRLYLIQSTTLAEGRKVEANYHLIDQILREFGGTDFLLDFEGSDIPGIAHFYKNFGGIDEPYFFYRFNRLPLLIRWLKPPGFKKA